MGFIRREFPEEYENRIGRLRRQQVERATERLRGVSNPRTLARALVGNKFSLAAISKELYLAWQELLRSLCPARPVLLDTIWVLERTQKRARLRNEAQRQTIG